jgi:hypothetical protein
LGPMADGLLGPAAEKIHIHTAQGPRDPGGESDLLPGTTGPAS